MGKHSRRHRTADTGRTHTGDPADPRASATAAEVERVLGLVLREGVWPRGWQPDEVIRHVRRQPTSARGGVDLVITAIAADATRCDRQHLAMHPAWRRQIDAISTSARHDPDRPGWFARWLADHGDVEQGLSIARSVLDELLMMRKLPTLIPRPGTSSCDVVDGADAQPETNTVLAKIRALLAKAESTEYQAEAEAFTAKAQAMMAKEHLDEAAVRGRAGAADDGRVSAIRIPLDEPYVAEKAFLLHVLAEANDARAVQHGEVALSTVVGPAATLRGIELLFVSLLIQVQAALTADTCASPAGSRARSRRYRASFIVGFAHRIGERLQAARAGVVADAPSDALPVLAADLRATSELLARLVGPTFVDRSRATRDPLGVASGAVAADRAALRDVGLARAHDRREHRPPDAVGR